MTITRTGNFFESFESGNYAYGAGAAGSLVIADGSVLTLPGGVEGALVHVGRNPGGNGILRVTGPGSALEMTGVGNTDPNLSQLSLQIGRNGGTGLFEVLGGASLSMVETAPVDVYFRVGRGEGGDGTARISGATMSVTSAGRTALDAGREGGTGLFELRDGAEVLSTGTLGSQLRIGIAEGDGTMLIDDARFAGQSAQGSSGLEVGGWDDGNANGLLTLRNGGVLELEGRESWANIGDRPGNTGTLRIESGARMTLAATEDFANVTVGRIGGTGTLELVGGGEVVTTGAGGTRLHVGVGGGTGTMLVDDASYLARSLDGSAGLQIGEWQDGGATGALTLRNGAAMRVEGHTDAHTIVGRFGDNTGTLRIESGSTLEIEAVTRFATVDIGQTGGEGNLSMSGGSRLDVRAEMDSWLLVGSDGGIGRAVLDGAEVDIAGGRNAGLRVAHRFSQDSGTGDGEVTLQNGTVMRIGGAESTNLYIAGEAGARGVVEVLSGSRIELGTNAEIRVGQPRFEQPGGGEARLVIDGQGSIIDGSRGAHVGGDGGTGTLAVTDGGWLRLGGTGMNNWTWLEVGWGPAATGRR